MEWAASLGGLLVTFVRNIFLLVSLQPPNLYISSITLLPYFLPLTLSTSFLRTFFFIIRMISSNAVFSALVCISIGAIVLLASSLEASASTNSGGIQAAQLVVDPSKVQPISKLLFGVFFEEINHAGDGGLWAELVNNRGFEAGGRHSPSWIEPWDMVGDDSKIILSTDLTSKFENNKAALKMDILCDKNTCPPGGVGVYNPGFLGMNIQQGKTYNIVFYVRSDKTLDLSISFTSADGSKVLASTKVNKTAKRWTRMEVKLIPEATDTNGRIQLTSTTKGSVWIDQVSAMPADTYKGHGFRSDLFQMVLELKPGFLRFPGGNYVEGDTLRNAFRWKETVGPWEERPGHLNDAWGYWANDGLGYFEYLQMAEDLGAEPVWVFNNGVSLKNTVNVTLLQPFIQEMLDSIEFANGKADTQWGSVRAKMGHVEPFNIKYVAIGNEECQKPQYRSNYLRFYGALKKVYPSINVISNCDGSSSMPLDHPADLYDYHVYTSPPSMFALSNFFNSKPRKGPKAFVSEYAVTDPGIQNDNGTLIAALSEAAFLMGIERNSDAVEMASYAPLFGQLQGSQWKPDAIFFNSFQAYGIPSYWMQMFFKESNGATLLYSNFTTNFQQPLVASAITFLNPQDMKNYIKIKMVNFFSNAVNVNVTIKGINPDALKGATQTIMTGNPYDENSLATPLKIAPKMTEFKQGGNILNINLPPYSLIAVDLLNDSQP